MVLEIEIDAELRRRLEAAAAQRGLPVRDDVVSVIRRVVDDGSSPARSPIDADWSRLSATVFARDWKSDADAVYGNLA